LSGDSVHSVRLHVPTFDSGEIGACVPRIGQNRIDKSLNTILRAEKSSEKLEGDGVHLHWSWFRSSVAFSAHA
jgi:hypothetical protein